MSFRLACLFLADLQFFGWWGSSRQMLLPCVISFAVGVFLMPGWGSLWVHGHYRQTHCAKNPFLVRNLFLMIKIIFFSISQILLKNSPFLSLLTKNWRLNYCRFLLVMNWTKLVFLIQCVLAATRVERVRWVGLSCIVIIIFKMVCI